MIRKFFAVVLLLAAAPAWAGFVTQGGRVRRSGDTMTGNLTVPVLYAVGVGTYSIVSSSGIKIIAGGITWPDGSVSTSAVSAGSAAAPSSTTLTWAYDNFIASANGVNTAFSLSQAPSTSSGIFVVLDGLLQSGTSDYTFTPPNLITMATAPALGSSSFFAQYMINTTTAPAAAILNNDQAFTGSNTFQREILATDISTYSMRSSSGVYIQAGGITWPDGSMTLTGLDPNDALLNATQTFSGGNTFQNQIVASKVGAYSISASSGITSGGCFQFGDATIQCSAAAVASSSGVFGSGTAGYLPKFTSSNGIGNSIAQESGSNIIVSGTVQASAGVLSSSMSFGTAMIQLGNNHMAFIGDGSSHPALSSCGSGAAFDTGSTENAGGISVGTGAGTSCTLQVSAGTWGQSTFPFCVVVTNDAGIFGAVTAVSVAGGNVNLSLGFSATISSKHVYYICL